MRRPPKNDTVERCAARLTAFLARQPRHKKTRLYVKSLPKRRAPVISPEEYAARREEKARQFEVARAAAAHVIERAQQGVNIEPIRKMRLRPKARTKWVCRPSAHRHRAGLSLAVRVPRDRDTCNADRIALYGAQNGLCGLCGKVMGDDPLRESLDHVIPIFDRGSDGRGNLLLCHGECNGAKSNDVPTGCELIFLLATNARLGVLPVAW